MKVIAILLGLVVCCQSADLAESSLSFTGFPHVPIHYTYDTLLVDTLSKNIRYFLRGIGILPDSFEVHKNHTRLEVRNEADSLLYRYQNHIPIGQEGFSFGQTINLMPIAGTPVPSYLMMIEQFPAAPPSGKWFNILIVQSGKIKRVEHKNLNLYRFFPQPKDGHLGGMALSRSPFGMEIFQCNYP